MKECTARYINRINPGTYIIEDSLYNNINDKVQHHEITSIPNNMEKSFVKVINEYINELRKTPISKELLDLF